MRKIANSFILPLIGALLLTSCLKEEAHKELPSEVAILSFSLQDIIKQDSIKLENGKDSTVTVFIPASICSFTIDQKANQIYNTDSLAYNAPRRLLTKMKYSGYLYYHKKDAKTGEDKKVPYLEGDSIDFTEPVRFTATSPNGQFARDYTITVNIRQSNPEVTTWQRLTDKNNFPAGLFTNAKAVMGTDSLYLFGRDKNDDTYVCSTAISDGRQWTTPEKLHYTEGTLMNSTADIQSVLYTNGTFYMTDATDLYESNDGRSWSAISTSAPITRLLTVTNEATPVIWGMSNEQVVHSTDAKEWTNGEKDGTFTSRPLTGISKKLKTNPNICRTLLIGESNLASDTCAQVWSKLSTEEAWGLIEPDEKNIYGCPNLEQLSVIAYQGNLYAFGGKSLGERKVAVSAFKAFYESRDNGITWHEKETGLTMSPEFKDYDSHYTAVTDNNNRLWMIWYVSGEIWQGIWYK